MEGLLGQGVGAAEGSFSFRFPVHICNRHLTHVEATQVGKVGQLAEKKTAALTKGDRLTVHHTGCQGRGAFAAPSASVSGHSLVPAARGGGGGGSCTVLQTPADPPAPEMTFINGTGKEISGRF